MSKDHNRDMNGNPINRSSSWGERTDKDTKKDRRKWRIKEQQQQQEGQQ
jgi:hypothetical protein